MSRDNLDRYFRDILWNFLAEWKEAQEMPEDDPSRDENALIAHYAGNLLIPFRKVAV